jgi:hypothetical protein
MYPQCFDKKILWFEYQAISSLALDGFSFPQIGDGGVIVYLLMKISGQQTCVNLQ